LPAISIGQMIVLQIPQETIRKCHLSIPAWDMINGTVGFCRDHKRAEPGQPLPYRGYDHETCLFSYEEHLRRLHLTSKDPWLLIGARNLGNNLRIIGYNSELGLLELKGEMAASSCREYTCLYSTHSDKQAIDRITFTEGKPRLSGIPAEISWAISGQELVWDGVPAPIERIIPYTYDLRHVWNMPGELVDDMGPRPYAGDSIEELIGCFMELEERPNHEIAGRLMELAAEKGYVRERNYLHNAVGISKEGDMLIIVQRHGAFEEVAQTLIQAGAWRAIELDQGGSCSVMMGDAEGFDVGRTIFASHYFRPRGLSLLVLHLMSMSRQDFSENSSLIAAKG
jgi:hypothetical protein